MTWNIFDWTAGPFLTLYAGLAAASLGAVWFVDIGFRRKPAVDAPGGLDPIELALLAKGEERAAEVIALQLVQKGYLFINEGRRRFLVRPDDGKARHPQVAALRETGTALARTQLREPLRPWIAEAWDRRARHGLLLSRNEVVRLRSVAAGIVGLVIVIGLIKVMVEASSGKPVGELVLMIVVTAILPVVLLRARGLATASGRSALRAYRTANQRLLAAPLPHEVLAAFAVVGVAALSGTAFAGYATLVKPNDSGCGGAAYGGTAGGGSGCGGGCGGCGGD